MSETPIREISFYNQSADFSPENEADTQNFLGMLLQQVYNKESYLINYIFLNPKDIQEMNREYLHHDDATDVITFDFSEDFGVFGGDIFVCPEIVFENARQYQTEPEHEMIRVLCHGLLHLVGYEDKTDNGQIEMKAQEEVCLELYKTR
jgi:probable rRNA maturation factor